jgi:hypothetical protein
MSLTSVTPDIPCPEPLRECGRSELAQLAINSPGEAREADLGVASGNGKGQIFVRGRAVRTVPESKIVETLLEEALRLTEETS